MERRSDAAGSIDRCTIDAGMPPPGIGLRWSAIEEDNALASIVAGLRPPVSWSWERLLERALDHGVGEALLEAVRKQGLAPPPAELRRTEHRLAQGRLWNALGLATLRELLGELDRAALRVVVLKGPLLGERLYPNGFLRTSQDLDLLVEPAQLTAALKAIGASGFAVRSDAIAAGARHLRLMQAGRPTIELHSRLSYGFGSTIPACEFVERSLRLRSAAGFDAWVLALEDELIYLAVHAARHLFRRLAWLYDLKLLMERRTALDWHMIAARSRAYGVLLMVRLTLEVLRRRLAPNMTMPAELLGSGGLRLTLSHWLLRPEIDGSALFRGRRQLYQRVAILLRSDAPLRAGGEFMRRRIARPARRP
jgi:hypothetical protein